CQGLVCRANNPSATGGSPAVGSLPAPLPLDGPGAQACCRWPRTPGQALTPLTVLRGSHASGSIRSEITSPGITEAPPGDPPAQYGIG
ncbi:MAG: hypothetical protein ACKOFW_04810, partial [Planctomycetaceae bacterium]